MNTIAVTMIPGRYYEIKEGLIGRYVQRIHDEYSFDDVHEPRPGESFTLMSDWNDLLTIEGECRRV